MLDNLFNNVKLINRISHLFNGFAIIILLTCGITYIINNWFMVENIIVTGNEKHITKNQIEYIANGRLSGSIFSIDIDKLRYDFMQLPWVKEVAISRVFPNSLMVNIIEYQSFARFANVGLITPDGEIFNGADDNLLLPVFYTNAEDIRTSVSLYHNILPVIAARNLHISSLEFDGAVITLILSDGEKIVLCKNELNAELNKLNLYWERLKIMNSNLKSMNFCYKNAVAINTPVRAGKAGIK